MSTRRRSASREGVLGEECEYRIIASREEYEKRNRE